MTDKRIINLQETEDPSGSYIILDSSTNGTKKYAIDSLMEAADEATAAATDAAERAEAAIEAIGDISELAVPEMSADTRGGAKVGDGLTVDSSEKLNLGPLVKHSTGVTDGSAIFGVQGEGYATQSGTPTPSNPQPIMVARGRNLIPHDYENGTYSTTSSTNRIRSKKVIRAKAGDTFTFSSDNYSSFSYAINAAPEFDYPFSTYNYAGVDSSWRNGSYTFTVTADCSIALIISKPGNTDISPADISNVHIQIELGSSITPYVPYGHVGLEVTANGQTTVTPVPIPTTGLASLPDGTKDTLVIDSAGHVGGNLKTSEVTLVGSSSEDWGKYGTYPTDGDIAGFSIGITMYGSANVNGYCSVYPVSLSNSQVDSCRLAADNNRAYLLGIQRLVSITTVADFKTWLATHPITIRYPVTPTTWDGGYIDLPTLPEGATVTIPELDNVGVDYWVKGIPEVTEYGLAMLARLESEIDEVEQAVADLSAAVANL